MNDSGGLGISTGDDRYEPLGLIVADHLKFFELQSRGAVLR